MSAVGRDESRYRLKFVDVLNNISVNSNVEIDTTNVMLQAFLENKRIDTNGNSSLLEKTVVQLQSMNDNPETYLDSNFPISKERFRQILIEEVQEKIKLNKYIKRAEATYRLQFFVMLNRVSIKTIGEIDTASIMLQFFLDNKYINTNGHSSFLEKIVMKLQQMKDNPKAYINRGLPISYERFRQILIEEVQEKIKQLQSIRDKAEEKGKSYEKYLIGKGFCFDDASCIFPFMDDIMKLIDQDLIGSVEDLLLFRIGNNVILSDKQCLVYIFGCRFDAFKLLLHIGIPCNEIVRLDLETLVKVFDSICHISDLIKEGEVFSNISNLLKNEFTIDEIVSLSKKDDDFMEWFILNINHIKELKRKHCPFKYIIELLEKSIPFLEQRVNFEEILHVFDEYGDVLDTIFDHMPTMIELLKAGMSLSQFVSIQHRNLRVSILSNSNEIIQLMKLGVTFSDLLIANITCYNRFLESKSTMNSVINLAKLGISCKEIIAQKNHKISRVLIIHCEDLLKGLNPIELHNGFDRVVAYLKNTIDGPFFDEEAFIKVIEDK